MQQTQEKRQVADVLKQFRLERDWTLARLSIYTGVHSATLQRIEKKITIPNDRTLYKLKKTIPAIAALEDEQIPA